MKRVLLYLMLLTIAVVGCKKNQQSGSGAMGELTFDGLEIQVENTERPLLSANTKTAIAASEPLEVIIYDANDKIVVRYASHLTMPLTTPLVEGHYTIKVQSSNRFSGVRFDTPQYSTTQTFEIQAFEITRISVLCLETTASVVVKYDNLFSLVFDESKYEYWAVLTSSLGDHIKVPSKDNKIPYFNLTNPDIKVYCQIFLKDRQTGEMLWDDTPSTPKVIYPIVADSDKGLLPGHNYTITIKI